MTPTADPATVPGLPESHLRPEHLAALSKSPPPAPWTCRARALVWVQRTTERPAFDWQGRPLPVAVGGFIEYLDTPVGPYHEVLAGSLVRSARIPAVQVPFIAVDSMDSVAGGRRNWALPKTVARFETDLTRATARAEGDGWTATIIPTRAVHRPALPLPIRLRFSAVGPLGTSRTSLRAHGRVIRVRTEVDGETLTGWLGRGTHLAVLLTGLMRIDSPSPLG
jgi:hypothetical protein